MLAGGYVSGVIEDGGVCTLTLTQGSSSVTVEGPAMPDATTTVCGGLVVPGEPADRRHLAGHAHLRVGRRTVARPPPPPSRSPT